MKLELMTLKTRVVIGLLALLGVTMTAAVQTRVNVGHLAPFAPNVSNTAVSVDVETALTF